MPNEFTCPHCGAAYAREKRRIGRAVICGCGHRFLVPPADEPPEVPQPIPGQAIQGRQPSAQHAAIPWAKPANSDDDEALPEAEVVYAGVPVNGPLPDDPFGSYGTADQGLSGVLLKPLPPRPTMPSPPARKPIKRRPKRGPLPVGIILLALLHFLAGAIVLAVGFLAIGLHQQIPPAVVLIVYAFLASLIVGLGVALLSGAKWAWWLSMFGQAWTICNGILGLCFLLISVLRFGAGGIFALMLGKYLLRSVISAFVLTYLLTENVLAYFRLKQLDTGRALAILFGLAISLQLVLAGVGYVLLRSIAARAA